MNQPARWMGDPDCGHLVRDPFQTHYCTYIRVPKLLTLQNLQTDNPEERLALLALQAIELWLKVVEKDVSSALVDIELSDPVTYEPAKLFYRASEITRVLDQHVDLAESVLVGDLKLRLPVGDQGDRSLSTQLTAVLRLTEKLTQRLSGLEHIDESFYYPGRDYLERFPPWADRYRRLLSELFTSERAPATSFANYLALGDLLDLQQGVMGDWAPPGEAPRGHRAGDRVGPDELMFIVVHQVFELWFRVLLHDLDGTLADLLGEPPQVRRGSRRMRRVVRTQKMLADMIHIPATMLPLDFLKFRNQSRVIDGDAYQRGLSPASGTESYQFRELEIVSGLKGNVAHHEMLRGNDRLPTRFLTSAQATRLQQPSLPEAFARLLERRGVGDVIVLFTPADQANPNADLAELADLLLEFDEFSHLWRVNHVAMVQSMIGRKSGTGFLGPEYLKETIGQELQGADERLLPTAQVRPRFFEPLWEARTRMGGYEESGGAKKGGAG